MSLRRKHSPSPPPLTSKPYISADILTPAEHHAQDQAVVGLLERHKRRKPFDVDDPEDQGLVVYFVVHELNQLLRNGRGSDMKPLLLFREYGEILTRDSLTDIVKESIAANSYRNVRNLAFLWKTPDSSGSRPFKIRVTDNTGATATLESWEEAYVGSAADCFWDTLVMYCQKYNHLIYARYVPIVNSSGMGKSRMVDELAKKHLVIPVNLRPQGDSGFPAADYEARDFLTGESTGRSKNKHATSDRCHAFLTALFEISTKFLGDIDALLQRYVKGFESGQGSETLAEKFRFLMTAGQDYNQQGQARRDFYHLVCQRAKKLLPEEEMITKLQDAAQSLLQVLSPDLDLRSNLSHLLPLVVLAYDEAHVLSDDKYNPVDNPWSIFSEFRRAHRPFNKYPIFSVFLSTSGKIQDILPVPQNDRSMRLERRELALLPPFTELGFDQMIQPTISEGSVTIDDVSTLKYMAMHGRPLFGARYKHAGSLLKDSIAMFAAEKLIGGRNFPSSPDQIKNLDPGAKLACMAVRLALEFNATTLGSQVKEREQVEKHMRVCLVVNEGFEKAVTIAPSEPLLAEGAFLIMKEQNAFDLPLTLLKELEGPGLDKGDRGELICLVLLTLARDTVAKKTLKAAIPLLDFMKSLLAHPWHEDVLSAKPAESRCEEESDRSFQETFAHSRIYFNHFVKVHDFQVINRRFLWTLKARGAAVLCANNQLGVDVVLPFVYRDATLQRDNISAILIQVKNDQNYTNTPNLFLFDAMDPYFVGFFDMDEANPLPIIRMVFALASKDAGVEVIECTTPRRDPPSFTAYDIWCAGASTNTFAVINPGQELLGVYQSLLKVGKVFPQVYGAKTTIVSTKSCRRNMNPGTAGHPDHWSRFAQIPGGEQVDRANYDFDVHA